VSNKERDAVRQIIDKAAIPTDGVVIVHSAFKRLSQQGYRAEPYIEALLEKLPRGTLLMPTMTWRTVTPQQPIFDELMTSSHTGVLSEIFRTQYATHRSLHPTHSVAGNGCQARALLSSHFVGNTPVPASSPYGLMQDYSSYVLLLGVGFEMCTAIHHAEELIAPDIYLMPKSFAEAYVLIDRNGNKINYKLRRHKKLMRNFEKYKTALLENMQLFSGDINGVSWFLLRLSDLYRVVFESLAKSPHATLHDESQIETR